MELLHHFRYWENSMPWLRFQLFPVKQPHLPMPNLYIVVNTIDSGCLLGKSTAIALGLLRVGQLSGSTLNAVTMQSNVEVGTRTFCRKTLCRKTFCRTDTLPTDVLPNGRFAERTFCRTVILPIGQFAERTINLPKIEMLFRQNVWDCDSFLNSVIINH